MASMALVRTVLLQASLATAPTDFVRSIIGRSVGLLADLSLVKKLLLMVFVPLLIVLTVTLPLTVSGLNRLENETSTSRLLDEIKLMKQRFAQAESDLIVQTSKLADNSNMKGALERGDGGPLQNFINSSRLGGELQHMMIVDATGQPLEFAHHGHGDIPHTAFESLHSLGLLEIKTTRMLATENGWLMIAVQPIKNDDGLIGALSAGRMLDSESLSELNFGRADPLVVVFDEENAARAISSTGPLSDMGPALAPDPQQRQLVEDGNTLLTAAQIGEEDFRIAYAEADLEGKDKIVFATALSAAPTAALRDRITVTGLSVTGGIALLTLILGFLVAGVMSAPILRLKEAAVAIGQGKLDTRVDIRSKDEVGQLGAVFNRMAGSLQTASTSLENRTGALEQSNAELQEFAFVAAHDLQEPLRKVQAFGDRLKLNYSEALDERGMDYMSRMQDASGRMQTLINDLLTYSRVTSKAQPFIEVDLSELAREVVSDLEISVKDADGIVEVGPLPKIEADRTQVRQLLQNIVGNALKFHRPEEPPVVTISGRILPATSARDGPEPSEICEILVQDNGIGFDEAYRDQIYGIFQRLHGRTEYGGTGLGLAVCRKIVERHGGTISARSTPGEGSTFSITLPVAQVANKED